MLAHILSVLGLVVYAHEVYRTVQNFGVRRSGLAGGAVSMPAAHIVMAALLGFVGFFVMVCLRVVPSYVGPASLFVSAYYFGSAIQYQRRRMAERKRPRTGN